MPEIEVPTEHLHELMHHNAEHASDKDRWLNGVALSSAIIAALTAVAALMAGKDANHAILLQTQVTDKWGYYQAKGVKSNVISTKVALLEALDKVVKKADLDQIKHYAEQQDEIQADAEELQALSQEFLDSHEMMAHAVTLFQVSIAVGAVSALARRRTFWYVSLVAAAAGLVFFTGNLRTHGGLQSRLEVMEVREAKKARDAKEAKEARKAKEKEIEAAGAKPAKPPG